MRVNKFGHQKEQLELQEQKLKHKLLSSLNLE